MFVRFRTARRRLQASLLESRRVGGKVRHEYIASLGSIDAALSVADRIAFWQQFHPRLDRLSNRLDVEASAKVLGAVHARIPMVTIDEQRALQIENAEADERFWNGLAEMQLERAEGNGQVADDAKRTATEAMEQADSASKKAAAAKDRVERLKRGEAVAGGLKQLTRDDVERVFREAGWTAADIKRAKQTHAIVELGGEAGFQELLDETSKRHRNAENAARRAVLFRQVFRAMRDGRITCSRLTGAGMWG